MMPTKEVIEASGNSLSISKSLSSSGASLTAVTPSCTNWVIAVPPNTAIHSTQTKLGINNTQTRNSRTVRPRLTRAMNMPTNGDQLIHQAQ